MEHYLLKKTRQMHWGKGRLRAQFEANFIGQFGKLSQSFPDIRPDKTSHPNAQGRECLVLMGPSFLEMHGTQFAEKETPNASGQGPVACRI